MGLPDRPQKAGRSVALAAKRDAVWVTRLRRDPDAVAWAIDGAPGLVEADRLDPAGLEVVLADEHLPAAARERCRRAGVPVLEPRFSARACLAAADALLARGDAIDPLLIEQRDWVFANHLQLPLTF